MDRIDRATLGQVLLLRTEQDDVVSPFAASSLYGGRPTYIYHAAIRAPGGANQLVGGIGIVFDAAAEFDAMLRGALGDKRNAQAYFVDRSGAIFASTDPTGPIGTELDIEPAMLDIDSGASAARVLTHDGHSAIMAAAQCLTGDLARHDVV